MSHDKIEGVSKVGEAYKTQASEGADQAGSEHFQNLMDSKSSIQSGFERLDAKNLAISGIDTENIDVQQTQLPDEDVSSQKSGSATDQEQKRHKGQSDSDSDEVEGISGVGGVNRKASSSATGRSEMIRSETGSNSSGLEEIKKQTHEIVNKMEGAKSQLAQASQANVEIKPSYQKLLRNHLTHIDDNIRIASSKLNEESTGGVQAVGNKASGSSVAERFLDMLTRSQHEMNNLQKTVEAASSSGTEMSPGQMLALQIKTNLISQELELFTNLLNKALEATKTIMNVQV